MRARAQRVVLYEKARWRPNCCDVTGMGASTSGSGLSIEATQGSTGRRAVLIAVVAAYATGLAAMVVLDSYGFVWKSLVVPGLLVAALVARGLTRFVNDWALFLAAVVVFDFCRGLVYALVGHFELHMYVAYVIDWERRLCGGEIGPVLLQRLRALLPDPGPLDRFFVLVHASHFLFFLVFGFVVWSTRPRAFRQYAQGMVVLMYVGLGFYLLVPTVPPWMAAAEFHAIPEITHVSAALYNLALPGLADAFDINPIAAMPSLHAAFPALCTLLALQHFGRRGVPAVVYTLAVWVAIVYLGEHYVIDVVAGAALAAAVFVLSRRWTGAAPDAAPGFLDGRRLVMALSLVGLAFGLGQLTLALGARLPVTREFVVRELAGRSDRAHDLLGRIAYARADLALAREHFARAVDELRAPADRREALLLLAMSAYRLRDFSTAVAALERLRESADTRESLLLLASAYVESGEYDKGMTLLEQSRDRFPGDPEPLYWLTRYAFLAGRVDDAHVRSVADQLIALSSANGERLKRALLELLQPDRTAGAL
jgi:tetratricopeptide (TPR) repeat protein